MQKILDQDFRNNLYKSLVTAGYSKDEAQSIVGVKYYAALKEDTNRQLTEALEHLVNDRISDAEEHIQKVLNMDFPELRKMFDYLHREEKEAEQVNTETEK